MLLKLTGRYELAAARQTLQNMHLSSHKINDFHAIVICEFSRLLIEVDAMLVPDMQFDFVVIGFVDRTEETCEHLLFTIPIGPVGLAVIALEIVAGFWLANALPLGFGWVWRGFLLGFLLGFVCGFLLGFVCGFLCL